MIDDNTQAHSLHYRGFTGSIEYSEADNVFHGRILSDAFSDIKDLVTYKANSISELNCAFMEVVDDYVLLEAMLNVY